MFNAIFVLVTLIIVVIKAESTGNSLVNCAACQALQVQIDSWSCDVNCQVVKGSNDDLVTSGVLKELTEKLNQLNGTVSQLKYTVKEQEQNIQELNQLNVTVKEQAETIKKLNNIVDTHLQTIETLNDTVNVQAQKIEKVEAPRDAFTATSYKVSAQNTAEAVITIGAIYKFPTEVHDELDSYDPATGIFTAKQTGVYSLLIATRSQTSTDAKLKLLVEKPNGDIQFVCKANSYQQREDSSCSILYELEAGDKVYPKGDDDNGKMNMDKKFGSFQAFFLY